MGAAIRFAVIPGKGLRLPDAPCVSPPGNLNPSLLYTEEPMNGAPCACGAGDSRLWRRCRSRVSAHWAVTLYFAPRRLRTVQGPCETEANFASKDKAMLFYLSPYTIALSISSLFGPLHLCASWASPCIDMVLYQAPYSSAEHRTDWGRS